MSGSPKLPHPQSPQSAASSGRRGYTWHTNGLFTYMQLHCYLHTHAHACMARVLEGSVCLWCEPSLSPDPFTWPLGNCSNTGNSGNSEVRQTVRFSFPGGCHRWVLGMCNASSLRHLIKGNWADKPENTWARKGPLYKRWCFWNSGARFLFLHTKP